MGADDTSQKNEALLASVLSYIPGVGGTLALLVTQHRWRLLWILGLLFVFFVVYPLSVPFIAAVLINHSFLSRWKTSYVATVGTAFGVEAAAKKYANLQNERLDYYQLINFSGSASADTRYPIAVKPYQRIKLRVYYSLAPYTTNPSCPVPRKLIHPGAKLYDIYLGSEWVSSVRNSSDSDPVEVTSKQWETMSQHMDSDGLFLELRPVEPLANLECDGVTASAQLSIEVFKDKLQRDVVLTNPGSP